MNNPNNFKISSDFVSTGNDNSVTITLNVPTHSIPTGTDSVYSTSVSAPSNYLGKQIRSQITLSKTGASTVPAPYVCAMLDVSWSGGTGIAYAFFDVTRVTSGNIQLRCRIANSLFPPSTISVQSFTVTARVRTTVGS